MANEITQTNKYLDWAGLSHFWTKVKEYIIANKSIVVDGHTVVNPGEGATVKWKPTENKWITVEATQDASNTTTYTVEDGNINAKFILVENELDAIKANAGVTGVKTVDAAGDYVKLTSTGSNPTGGFDKGDITITLDDTGLNSFASTTTTNITTVDNARKDDIQALYGTEYDAAADTLGASGAVKGNLSASGAYNTITKINQRLKAIDASVVTKVTANDVNEGEVDYIKFTSSAAAGTGDIELTVDEKALDTKIVAMDKATTDEVAARQAADALLAGDGWDETAGNWTNTPNYATIAKLSQQVLAAEGKIDALSSATHFIGVFADQDAALAAIKDFGDIFIIGNKEYIYNSETIPATWANVVELGDTTEEVRRISALEAWVNAPITNDEINTLFVNE